MGTSYQTVFDAFLYKVEEDKNFFNLINLQPEEAEDIIRIRSKALLTEAISILALRFHCPVDFTDYDDVNEAFNFDLSGKEVILLASFMYQVYLGRTLAKLKDKSVDYTATELRVFDPSNARSTYLELYNKVCQENEQLIDGYLSQERSTGEYLVVDQSAFNDE